MSNSNDIRDAPSPSADSLQTPRRPSFGFLRSKSQERVREEQGDGEAVIPTASRSNSRRSTRRSFSSGNKLVKRHIQRDVEEILRQAKEDIPDVPPLIPSIAQQPRMQTFGGDEAKRRSQLLAEKQRLQYQSQLQAQQRDRSNSGNTQGKPSIDMGASINVIPIPPLPSTSHGERSESSDPYARTESMTNRGRYSYASSVISTVNGPRRVRRRKDPTPFNILIVGATNAGKTSFIDFLRTSCALPAKKQRQSVMRQTSIIEDEDAGSGNKAGEAIGGRASFSPAFQSHYLETEMGDGERIGLTLWDSDSLEANIVDLQLREIAAFIESKFEETYSEENRLIRTPGFRDTHIHCVFLVLDPTRLDLTMAAAKKALLRSDPAAYGNAAPRLKDNNPLIEARILDDALDVQVVRALQGKTAVVPVISKADTVTSAHMKVLKRSVYNALKKNGLDPLETIGIDLEDDDSEDSEESDSDDSSEGGGRINGSSGRRDKYVDAQLEIPSGRKASSVSPSRSAKTEDSDVLVDRPGGAAATSKESDPDYLPPLPLSILTPDPPDIHHNEAEKKPGNVGRAFPWGFADPYNPTHCDFLRLKEVVLGDWRTALREKSREVWYENWRTNRLRGGNSRKTATGSRGGTSASSGAYRGAAPSTRTDNTHRAGNVPNVPRGNPPAPPTVGGGGGGGMMAGASSSSRASPAVAYPMRDVSPGVAGGGGGRSQTHYSSNSMGAVGNGSQSSYRAVSTAAPGAAARPRQREYGSLPPSTTGHRHASQSSQARAAQGSAGGDYMTALPAVGAEEVGLAR